VKRTLHWRARDDKKKKQKIKNINNNATRLSHRCIIKMIATGDVAFIVRVLFNDNVRRAPQVTGNRLQKQLSEVKAGHKTLRHSERIRKRGNETR